MNRISSGFIGTRLRDIRESFGMPVVTLATLLDVHRNTIAEYEDGALPDEKVLDKLQKIFNVPRFYFFSPVKRQDHTAPLFRAKARLPEYEKRRAEIYLEWAQEFDTVLTSKLSLPKVNIPRIKDFPASPNLIENQNIFAMAKAMREAWGLSDGPVANVVGVLEKNGFVICHSPLENENIDALSYSNKQGRPYILVNSDKKSSARLRFTTMHEAAHLTIHANLPEDLDYSASSTKKMIEDQAHLLALDFLLGPLFVSEASSVSLAVLKNLKPRWKVSIQAMMYYLNLIGVINESRYNSLRAHLSKHGWTKLEPFDLEIAIERPAVFRASLKAMSEKMKIRSDAIENMFPIPISLIQKFLSVAGEVVVSKSDDTPISVPRKNLQLF